MDTHKSALYLRHRIPSEIIKHCVWLLYFLFSLSYRDVEGTVAKRGIQFSYEAIRDWRLKFGRLYSKRLR